MNKKTLSLLLWLASLSTTLQADEMLERVAMLGEGGATQLALRLVEHRQPPPSDMEAWMAWEKQRFRIYRAQGDWDALCAQAERLPMGVPGAFRRWALTEAAEARLNAADAAGARKYLRRLLWQEQSEPAESAKWRRMVIRSYLMENAVEDAQAALLRYKQEYSVRGADWQLLHARVLLSAGRARDAYGVLVGNQSYEGRLLRLMAALRARVEKPDRVLVSALRLAKATASQPAVQRHVWLLVAEAATAVNDKANTLLGIEWGLSLPGGGDGYDHLFKLTADDLWQAYLAQAQAVGNAARLLVGDDAAWLKRATSYKDEEAYLGRAFYAFLARHAAKPETRVLAHQRLTDSLIKDGRQPALRLLYLASQEYPEVADIPANVRHRLADLALQSYDIELASRLIKGLDQPLAGEDEGWWTLRQARILVYAGEVGLAVNKLEALLKERQKLDKAFVGHVLQVLFDLQAMNRHSQALPLFELLYERATDETTRREMLFWMADSYSAEGQHAEAAEFYLRSAVYGRTPGGDMWGQSARFHAAEALAKGGLIDDARAVYAKLMQQTTDPKQRALIQRNAQQLWLLETTPMMQ